ncbi:hypothetical protein H257_02283 [Aphanomyces astaci]|uniref:Uncharacterized protein n=1 Tax=Aphanomyces astaci TaxID=112090 RepID=W4H1A5_APHAT|nr:hypothetical protein H257_02283 [Aphanomyces astaci]ETV85672.1 hypothetical protein H257_02283 [Aphanomyces astaci]|eukprot:XP_009824144.1 hypothetical protein H257_02283 [Aphanomyces astaci]
MLPFVVRLYAIVERLYAIVERLYAIVERLYAIVERLYAIVVRLKDVFYGDANTPFTAHTPTPVAAAFEPPRQLRHQLAPPTCPLSPMTMIWDKAMSAASCTTPALPDPPSFRQLHQVGAAVFIRLYNKDVFTKKRVAMWDMANRDYRGVANTQWAAWFSKAFEEKPQDLEVLKKRLTTAIRFDTTILDADSQIGKMLDNLMQALERDDEAWDLEKEKP